MKHDMIRWAADLRAAEKKRPLPILSFPAVSLLGIGVGELLASADNQARGMEAIAARTDAAAAVSLMDLSLEAEAFGAKTVFREGEVPNVTGTVVGDEEEAAALAVPAVGAGRTGIAVEAIRLASEAIRDRPVFAGVIGPFSLAGRLVGVSDAMINCYEEPEMMKTVLEKAAAFLISYCEAFRDAGASGVLLAEPLAGMLSPTLAEEFSHPYVKRIVDAVQSREFAVIYHNCGDNAAKMTGGIYGIGALGYHFGDAVSLPDMLRAAPPDVLVMGNVSPAAVFLHGTPDSVRTQTRRVLRECGAYPNFVLSSGCDLPPKTPWENIDAFFEAGM